MLTRYDIIGILDRVLYVYAAVQLQKEYIKQNSARIGNLETANNQATNIMYEASKR